MDHGIIPDRLPMLSASAQAFGTGRASVMQAAGWLASEEWSDAPRCVHPVVAAVARDVGALVSDATRERLWPLVLRSVGTARPCDAILAVRLVAWCARQAPDTRRERSALAEALDAVDRWCDCPCEAHYWPALRRARLVEALAAACVRRIARRARRRRRDAALVAVWDGVLDAWERWAAPTSAIDDTQRY